METAITSKEKAKQLINMYYANASSQIEAIEISERVVLTTLCQIIDSLHGHIFYINDFDFELTKSQIGVLKSWQEVAAELQNIKTALPV
jgi:hypothetical protein